MKRTLIFLLFFTVALALHATRQQYAANSVLANGSWYKISVKESGVYKLSYEDISSMGIGDPTNVRIYGYGGAIIDENLQNLIPRADDLPEIAVFMDKGADNVFSAGDYILFYAQGTVKDEIDKEHTSHTYTPNYYANEGCYFVTCSFGEGKKITASEPVSGSPNLFYNTTNAGYYIYSDQYNLIESGREWYGYKCSGKSLSHSFTIADSNIDTSEKLLLEIVALGKSSSKNSFSGTFNNDIPLNISINATSYAAGKGTLSTYIDNSRSSNPTVSLKYNPNTSSDIGYIDYITANYKKFMHIGGGSLLITNPEDIGTGKIAQYNITGADNSTQIWDITDPSNARFVQYTLSGNNVSFIEQHDSFHKYVAFNLSSLSAKTPQRAGNVANQNLHAYSNPDMVIITNPDYIEAANKLADFHRTNDGFNVHVLTPEPIYNEFSSGTHDASAYRLLMKMFYDRYLSEGKRQPKYLLFLGTAFYDNRGITLPQNPLLSYQSVESLNAQKSFITDDFFGQLDDDGDPKIAAAALDISVGRMPVTSANEAMTVVQKTIGYVTSSSCGDWRTLCSFLADDGDNNVHEEQANTLADFLSETNGSFKIDKVFLDSFKKVETSSGSSYPGARDKILKNIKNGTLLFTFVGHGSPNTMTTEQTINKNDIINMYNKNLGLWLTATCDFSRYDNNQRSAGMEVINNPSGGGIALFTTTRVVYSDRNFSLMRAVYNYIVPKENEEYKTLGEIFKLAKNSLKTDENKLNFSLLGDPAIRLHYPSYKVMTDSINGTEPADATMQALGLVTVKGHLEDLNGEKLDTYTGDLRIVVYDKQETLHTLGQSPNTPFEYKDYINKLFIGTTSVASGKFEFTFMVPQDINYKIGNGKILYYAWKDNMYTEDAFGNNTEFNVGGTDPTVIPSEEGPTIRAYMNSPEFKNGDKVNKDPVFYAHLFDNNGINVVGAGIGHDVIATLRGKSDWKYILNDYYTSTLDDYRAGVVKYQFKDLEEGSYTLDFKVWNLQNISSTASLDFVVKNKLNPGIEEFSMYPNPATVGTTFYLRHNRPEIPISVTFIVYDMFWNEYWESTVTESTDGVFKAYWDLTGKQGNMVSGIYCVRAKITMPDGSYTHKVQKIIVKKP
ncbi:MAG: type IX secretion system sortase PorU [Paludibacteraceae bacterium]|nr:type IX secretion system sortase PorU [Paludibacteraceae bacterium]